MGFKKEHLKLILFASVPIIFLLGLSVWKFSQPPSVAQPLKDIPVMPVIQGPPADTSYKQEDAALQEQFDRDRQAQKQTKYLKIKLEQANLELEQEKAVAEIDKLKMENRGTFKDSTADGQKNVPQVIVEYIGGDSIKKEAILSIGGSSYQVKEKSSPTDNIQVMAISGSSVTLHFSAPRELIKTIDYKPE